jgi:glycogen debranching enzyme
VYKLPARDYVTDGADASLITNGFGSYFAHAPSMSYQGWYQLRTKNWRMQKIIESITPLDDGKQTALYQQFYGLRRTFASGGQDVIVPYQKTVLYHSLRLHGRILLTLDHRESYEGSLLGRNYSMKQKDGVLIIHFKKEGGEGQDASEEFLVVKGAKDIELVSSWKEKKYSFDEKRKTPDAYWVYDACTFFSSGNVVFAFGETENEALTLADISYHHFDDILSNMHERALQQLPLPQHIVHPELHAAASCAAWSLQSLHQRFFFERNNFSGILAGLPWFFQVWSRDELISLKGLMHIADMHDDEVLLADIKKILDRHLKSVGPDGRLANRYPSSMLGSADALGWLAKRVTDFLRLLKSRKRLYTLFSIPQLIGWSETLKSALAKTKHNFMKDDLVFCNAKETWMDTTFHDDGRPGFRIELQALHDALFEAIIFLEKLVGSPETTAYEQQQRTFRKAVRDVFLRDDFGGKIIDGMTLSGFVDRTYRPNIFLAAYLAPQLFSKQDWLDSFAVYVGKLYLPWGGFATLSQDNSLFSSMYTGADDKSYHRGDSWYFLNNLAAIVLSGFDEKTYDSLTKFILFASAKDIVSLGFAGHASEVSSAAQQTGDASLMQAWSAATFIELLEFLQPSHK